MGGEEDIPHPSEVIKYKLVGKDGPPLEISHAAAQQINFIKNLLDDQAIEPDTPIPVSEVSSSILALVIEFCEYMEGKVVSADNIEEIDEWEKEFLKIDDPTLYQLTLAANFLDVQGLLNICCKHIADNIKGKSCEEIREDFKLDDEFKRKVGMI